MKDKTTVKSKPRAKFYVDRKGHFVHDAVLFMLLSAVFRGVGSWGLWTDRFFVITQILLPVGSCLLFALILRFLGDKAFSLTILPVLAGAAFFVIRALGFDNMLQTVLCIALCVLAAVLYMLTAIGLIRTKWILVPLFAAGLVYRVFVEDLIALRDTANPVLFADGMMELSVISLILGLMFAALALKKRKLLEEANLPKIKDPVVIKPQKPAKPQTTVPAAATAAAKPAAVTQAKPSAPSPAKPAEEPVAAKPAEEAPAAQTKAEESQQDTGEAAPTASDETSAENK